VTVRTRTAATYRSQVESVMIDAPKVMNNINILLGLIVKEQDIVLIPV
jgi:uncharacterized protein YdhG (YjbR/CyaY superfamily)